MLAKVKAFLKAALPTVAVAVVVYIALRKAENKSEKVKELLS